MKLNDAHIENMLDAAGNELTLVRKFGEVVKHAELVADVYMNDRKVFTAPVCVTENTGYLMASIDGRFALDPAITLERVLVRVRHVGRDEVLFSSNTVGVNQPIDAYDYDADIYFRLMNVWEGNTTRTRAPETKFRCLYKNTFGTINLDEQPSAYDDVEPDPSGSGDGSSEGGSDGSSDGGSDGGSQGESESGDGSQSGSGSGSGNTPEFSFALIDADSYEVYRDTYLSDYMSQWGDQSGIGQTWEEVTVARAFPWLAINCNFNDDYDVVVKYNGEVRWDSTTADGGVKWNPIPKTAGPNGDPRTYLLLGVDDLGFGVNYQYYDDRTPTGNTPLAEENFSVEITKHQQP